MLFKTVKSLGKENGWHRTASTIFGTYQHYFFNIGDGWGFKWISARLREIPEEEQEFLRTELDRNKKVYKYQEVLVTESEVLVKFAENFLPTKKKTLYAAMDFLSDLFSERSYAPMETCHNCSSPENPKPYDLSGTGIFLCRKCHQEVCNTIYETEREELQQEKNYLSGFLGSVIFSLAGVLGWVLVAVLLNQIASALAMVIAFLGIKGYEYFKGKRGVLTKWIIVSSNILCVLLANYATAAATLLMDEVPADMLLELLLYHPEVKDMIFSNTMMSGVLCLFVWIWLFFSMNYKLPSVKPAQALASADFSAPPVVS